MGLGWRYNGKSIPSDRLGGGFPDGLDVVGNGAFTGRITGTDIAVTDSIKGTSAHLTGRLVSESLKANISVFDSLKLGTGSYLKTYVEGTMPCTLKTSDVTVQKVGTITYKIIGKTVTLTFPFIYGTSNSTSLRLYCGGLTGLLDPGSSFSGYASVVDNGVSYSGSVIYAYGLGNYFLFNKYDNSGFTSSSSKGVGDWLYTSRVSIQYTTD